MPQPKKPAAAKAPETPDETPDAQAPETPDEETRDRVKPGDFNPAVHDLLFLAQDLQKEKEEVYGKIDDNRQVLRRYLRMGMVNDDQREAVEAFYPFPKKKVKEEGSDNGAAAETPADDQAGETPATTAA
jgi:hypothetical protein